MIERACEPQQARCDRRILIEHCDRPARRLRVQCAGIVHECGRRANPRGERQASREPVIEAVNRLHVQPRRILLQAPAEFAASRERSRGMTVQFFCPLVRILRQRLASHPERCDDAMAHLRRGLARECDRDDLFRTLDVGQQAQESQRQERCLPGTRGRLHDERAGGLDGAHARCAIEFEHVTRHRSNPLRRLPARQLRRGTARPGDSAGRSRRPASGRPRRDPRRTPQQGVRATRASGP